MKSARNRVIVAHRATKELLRTEEQLVWSSRQQLHPPTRERAMSPEPEKVREGDWRLSPPPRRSGGTTAAEVKAEPPPAPVPDWEEVTRRWHRQLALVYHPDKGGSVEAMEVVNAGYALLKQLLTEQHQDAPRRG